MSNDKLINEAKRLTVEMREFKKLMQRHILSRVKGLMYESGLVAGGSNGVYTFHKLYKLKKPWRFTDMQTGEAERVEVVSKTFYMTVDSGFGSFHYNHLTGSQLVRLLDHIEKEVGYNA